MNTDDFVSKLVQCWCSATSLQCHQNSHCGTKNLTIGRH